MSGGRFEHFVGIDWSGARGSSHRGIAVARCDREGRCRVIAPPGPSRRWSRAGVLSFLADAPAGTLAGIDCALSLPWGSEGPLPDGLGQPADADALWTLVDECCRTEADLYAGPVYRPEGGWLAPFMFTKLTGSAIWQGSDYSPGRLRRTEMRLVPAPNSVFRVVGAKTVGPGSFAGMRLLAALRARRHDLAIWPFDDRPRPDGLTVVEIYPSLSYAGAGHRGSRRSADLDLVLARLGATIVGDRPAAGSDAADAMVAAAALRATAGRPDAFAVPADPRIRREGWIFGVPSTKGDAS